MHLGHGAPFVLPKWLGSSEPGVSLTRLCQQLVNLRSLYSHHSAGRKGAAGTTVRVLRAIYDIKGDFAMGGEIIQLTESILELLQSDYHSSV
jgi:hypothetical protein